MPPQSSPIRPSSAPRSSSPPVSHKASQEGQTTKKRSITDEAGDNLQDQGVSTKPTVSNEELNTQAVANDVGLDGKQHGNPNKRRKLTLAEKEEKEREKVRKEQERVEKEKEKAEKKAALEEKKKAQEEAKKKKDEEKQKKDEEKAEAQRKKDEEKRKRDEEKAKKDEEKAKKARTQTRLSAFFAKPKGESSLLPSSKLQLTMTASDKSMESDDRGPANPTHPSDYERYFKPFFVKQHVTVAPQNSFIRDTEYKEFIQKQLDNTLTISGKLIVNPMDLDHTIAEKMAGKMAAPTRSITADEMADLLHIPHHKRVRRGNAPKYTVKQLLELINTSEAEITLSSSLLAGQKSPNYYLALLNALPTKHLHFAEDVRPPYSGTFTRVPPINSGLRKGRNPFERSLPNVDYDYDSEAEWVAPEEEEEDGEDLLSELGDEEEDEDAEDEEEMDEFLDDEDDAVKRRAGALCPLLPFSSGLCWEDDQGRNEKKELQEMKLGILIEGVSSPINPFSGHYWLPKAANSTSGASPSVGNPIMSTFLSPATTSLPHRPAINIISPQTPKKLIPTEDLEAFKKAVDGSDMTKAGLVELLKKQFPKASKDSIRETLGKVAVRIGGKEADKRWVLRD